MIIAVLSYCDFTIQFETDPEFIEPQLGGASAKRRRIVPQTVFALIVLAILAVAGIFLYRFYHPALPPAVVISDIGQLNNGVWTEAERQRYYHLTQGSQIIPYDWFLALEQPGLAEKDLFISPAYTAQFRLVPDPNPLNNPDRLPVGFAKDDPDPITKIEYAGVTCAACHTAQMIYKGMGLRIDGAPGMVNLDEFLFRLGLAVFDTLHNPFKFDRFAKRILKDRYSSENAKKLKGELKDYYDQQTKARRDLKEADRAGGLKPVDGGFGRIDGFGAGGNRLFGALTPKNLRTLNAPVKALPLWNVSKYSWVQTNGA